MPLTPRLLLIAGVAVLLGAASPGRACQLAVGWTPDPPFQMNVADGGIGGIDLDLLQEAAQSAGCTVSFKPAGAATPALDQVRRGTLDVAAGVSGPTAAATQPAPESAGILYSQPYRMNETVLVVRKGDSSRFRRPVAAAIAGQTGNLGTVAGQRYGDEFERLRRTPTIRRLIIEAPTLEQNFAGLLSGTLDSLVENGFVALAAANKLGIAGRIELHPEVIGAEVVRFAFSSKTVPPATATAIDAAMAAMAGDGRYDRILARYLKSPTP